MTGFERRLSERSAGGERGVTLITFALSLVAICSVIALVLGGSIGYTAERNSQTASDAAALAATNKLWQVQTRAISATQVLQTAQSVAIANGANSSDVTCRLVAANRTHIADCGSASAAQFRAASGVAVDTRDTRGVPFGEVSGNTEITGATLAIATIQPVTSGRSPFMMCAPAAGHGAVKVLDPAGNINESAVGVHYLLQGTAMKDDGRDCGNPASNWRGWVAFDSTFPLPGEWAIENGNKSGHIPRQLLNDDACGGSGTDVNDYVGCTIAVPLCTSGNGMSGNNFRVNCVTWGAFKISHNGNGPSVCHSESPKHICGEFVGGALAREGQGTEDKADPNEVAVIKLVR